MIVPVVQVVDDRLTDERNHLFADGKAFFPLLQVVHHADGSRQSVRRTAGQHHGVDLFRRLFHPQNIGLSRTRTTAPNVCARNGSPFRQNNRHAGIVVLRVPDQKSSRYNDIHLDLRFFSISL